MIGIEWFFQIIHNIGLFFEIEFIILVIVFLICWLIVIGREKAVSRSYKKKRSDDNRYKKSYQHRLREEEYENGEDSYSVETEQDYEDYQENGYVDDEYYER